jgi:hypothetical protein
MSGGITLGVYTHVELQDQTAAIGAQPGPPTGKSLNRRATHGFVGSLKDHLFNDHPFLNTLSYIPLHHFPSGKVSRPDGL